MLVVAIGQVFSHNKGYQSFVTVLLYVNVNSLHHNLSFVYLHYQLNFLRDKKVLPNVAHIVLY